MMWPVVVVLCYLLGSIPGSYLIGRWVAGVDLRTVGSGNVGASNVLRVAGPAAYAAAIALDVAKGLAAVLVVPPLGGGHLLQTAGGIAAVGGHMFPVWLGFKGGKGVATTVGVFLGLSPVATLLAAGVWLVVILSTRYASVASLLAVGSLPFLLYGVHRWRRPELHALSVVLLAVVLWRHRPNLKRLSEGQETRLTWKRKKR